MDGEELVLDVPKVVAGADEVPADRLVSLCRCRPGLARPWVRTAPSSQAGPSRRAGASPLITDSG